MKAVVLGGEPGQASLVTDRPYPKPRSGYVLVDTKAVALVGTFALWLWASSLAILMTVLMPGPRTRRTGSTLTT
jgi:hypothetical protein